MSDYGLSAMAVPDGETAQARSIGIGGKRGRITMRRLLSIKEAAEYTGLSVHTLYTMVSQRRIPYVKAGRLTKFDLDLLDAWIKQNTVMPLPEKRG